MTADEVRRAAARELRALGIDVGADAVELEVLTHNRRNQVTDGIWKVRAAGFEAVLKVMANRPGGDPTWQPSTVPTEWNYWRREADAYRSGLTDAFAAAGVRGPRALQVVDRPDGTIAIWMESVAGRSGHAIDEAAIEELSYRLGVAQAAWIEDGGRLPAWASRRFLRDYTGSKTLGWELLDDDAAWAQPVVAAGFPPGLREGAVRLHRDRQWLLSVMEQLPRTLAHLDVWPNNVIVADDGDMVLVDWAFVGDGALGEDVGNLVPDAVFDRFLPADRLPPVAEGSLDCYLSGLRDGGWVGNDQLVRLGLYASAGKYDWLVPLMLDAASAEQRDYGGEAPVDPTDRYRERGLALLELTRWHDRARQLVRDDPSLLAPQPASHS